MTTLKEALFAQNTNEVFLPLFAITGDDLDTPIYLVPNTEEVVSHSVTYSPFPVELTLPDDTADTPLQAKIRVSGVSREMVQALRLVSSPLLVSIKIVKASDPDTTEALLPDFELRNASFDADTVEGDLVLRNLTSEPFPYLTFTPGYFPGVFAGDL